MVELKPVRLKQVRERKGWSMAMLSREACIGVPQISLIESGRYIPYERELRRIADALGVEDADTLLEPLCPEGGADE